MVLLRSLGWRQGIRRPCGLARCCLTRATGTTAVSTSGPTSTSAARLASAGCCWRCSAGLAWTIRERRLELPRHAGLWRFRKSHADREAQARGREFLLAHRLFRSHRTGNIVQHAMTRFAFPPRWQLRRSARPRLLSGVRRATRPAAGRGLSAGPSAAERRWPMGASEPLSRQNLL